MIRNPGPPATAPDPVWRAHHLPNWKVIEERADGVACRHVSRRMTLIVSTDHEDDGRTWCHISIASRDFLPSWDDLKEIKKVLIGEEWEAYQVFPRASKYVNQHPNALHLWACLDEPAVLPDFTHGGTSI